MYNFLWGQFLVVNSAFTAKFDSYPALSTGHGETCLSLHTFYKHSFVVNVLENCLMSVLALTENLLG